MLPSKWLKLPLYEKKVIVAFIQQKQADEEKERKTLKAKKKG